VSALGVMQFVSAKRRQNAELVSPHVHHVNFYLSSRMISSSHLAAIQDHHSTMLQQLSGP
jgi:hypothetical protein